MNTSNLHNVFDTAQHSIWLDNLSRVLIQNGDLKGMVRKGVRGITSNPSIFQKALEDSSAYAEQLKKLRAKHLTAETIYWKLVHDDIKQTARILRSVYDDSNMQDGFVSVEVDPRIAHDTHRTVAEALELHRTIDEPNVMIKVPATTEGLPAITELVARGISVNVTLIFSIDVYEKVLDAYMSGLEHCDKDLSTISSVASFFVSRVDGVVDDKLPEGSELRGRIAIAQARQAYRTFLEHQDSARWQRLLKKNATPQRPLWASTSTKNPDYPDTLYVDSLVAPHTVNTLQQTTLEAYLDHGSTAIGISDQAMRDAARDLSTLGQHGIDLKKITTELERKGVEQFIDSFNEPLERLGA